MGGRLSPGSVGPARVHLGVHFLTLSRGLSTRCVWMCGALGPAAACGLHCFWPSSHCRHRLNGRCPHSRDRRLAVRQQPQEGPVRCSSRGGMSVLPQGCLLAGSCPVGTLRPQAHHSPVWLSPLLRQVTSVLTPVWTLVSTGTSSALCHRWAFPSGRRLLENQAVVVRGGDGA